jgi:hypothetical protein
MTSAAPAPTSSGRRLPQAHTGLKAVADPIDASGQELTGVPGANTSLLSWAKAIQRISRVVCRVLVASFEA